MEIAFAPSARSTIGIEWELALVDADSGDLRQVAQTVLERVRPTGADAHPNVHPELLLNTIEVVSGVATTVAQAGSDLERTVDELRAAIEPLRVELMCAGTHPFARYDYQRVTNKERYSTLIERTQWWGRQMVIYGVHVHVGIEDQRKVLPILRAMLSYFPHLQSLSASSPFWSGRDTGYASNRALLFQQLPTAGLPQVFDEWAELEAYTRDMLHTGVIDHFNEIRWDVRPAPHLGTLEMRVFDGASNLTEVLALAALTHCLVEHFSTMLDDGRELPRMPSWFLQENKWRSARYGMDAIVILDAAGNEQLVTESLEDLLGELEPVAAR
ncbi:MAG TPA: glutamate--cysteine ligase, partial [Phototrophicaceae bacterium]|nr:glutamate--cysteine ligase [Phototrophicaceae bacterium]